MARHKIYVEVAAPAAGATLCNIPAAASGGYHIRRLVFGVRTSGVPVSQGVTVQLKATTARGTPTSTTAAQRMDPNSIAPQLPGADTAWSVTPTIAAAPLTGWSFNTQTTYDHAEEFTEELVAQVGNANGFALVNVANPFPGAHTLTIEIEVEE